MRHFKTFEFFLNDDVVGVVRVMVPAENEDRAKQKIVALVERSSDVDISDWSDDSPFGECALTSTYPSGTDPNYDEFWERFCTGNDDDLEVAV